MQISGKVPAQHTQGSGFKSSVISKNKSKNKKHTQKHQPWETDSIYPHILPHQILPPC